MKNIPIGKIFESILSLIYPPKCISCGQVLPRTDQTLCEICRKRFDTESKMPCPICGKAHVKCSCKVNANGLEIPLIHVTGYDLKRNSVSKNIIFRLKDDNIKSGFDFVSREMASALKDRIPPAEDFTEKLITFVPRSKKAKRKAGHDQSEILAKNISVFTGAKFMPLLSNNSHKMQKKLGREKRMENAEKSYCFDGEYRVVTGKSVIIVDDIVTTGASIGVCAGLLLKAGATDVTALVYARTVSGKQNNNYYE